MMKWSQTLLVMETIKEIMDEVILNILKKSMHV